MTQTAAISAGDTAWVLASSALVLLMTVGLACFYSGLVRSKNSLNTMMMSIVAMGAIGVQWVLLGYSLAFAPGSGWLGGLAWVALRGVGARRRLVPRTATRLPQSSDIAAQRAAGPHRRRTLVVRLVRFQRRLGARGQRTRRPGIREHERRSGRCRADVGGPRFDPDWEDHGCRRRDGGRRGVGPDNARRRFRDRPGIGCQR